MKVNSRFLYGILSILLAAIIAFIAIPTVTRKTNSKVEIVRITTALDRGDPITAKDVELAEVGGFNLPDNVATKLEDVIGTYAASSLYPGDYILSGKVSSTPLSSDLTLNAIPDGMVAISITVQSCLLYTSNQYDDKIEYVFYCEAQFRIHMFGRAFPPVTQRIELTGSHHTKY